MEYPTETTLCRCPICDAPFAWGRPPRGVLNYKCDPKLREKILSEFIHSPPLFKIWMCTQRAPPGHHWRKGQHALPELFESLCDWVCYSFGCATFHSTMRRVLLEEAEKPRFKKKKKCGGLLSEFVWQVPYSWIPTVDMGMTQSSRANRLWTLGRQLSAHFSKLDCISSVKSLILPGGLPLVTDGPRTHFIHLDRGLVIWVGWSQRGSIPRLLYLWSLLSFLPNLLFLQVFIKHPLCVIVASITVLGTRGGGEWAVLTTRNSEGVSKGKSFVVGS